MAPGHKLQTTKNRYNWKEHRVEEVEGHQKRRGRPPNSQSQAWSEVTLVKERERERQSSSSPSGNGIGIEIKAPRHPIAEEMEGKQIDTSRNGSIGMGEGGMQQIDRELAAKVKSSLRRSQRHLRSQSGTDAEGWDKKWAKLKGEKDHKEGEVDEGEGEGQEEKEGEEGEGEGEKVLIKEDGELDMHQETGGKLDDQSDQRQENGIPLPVTFKKVEEALENAETETGVVTEAAKVDNEMESFIPGTEDSTDGEDEEEETRSTSSIAASTADISTTLDTDPHQSQTNKRLKIHSAVLHQCERCGKVYKHKNCLGKHLWEHHESWDLTKKWCQTKHQQVQMLEAAQVLVQMTEQSDLTSSLDPIRLGRPRISSSRITALPTRPVRKNSLVSSVP